MLPESHVLASLYVVYISSYVKDTTDFINKIEKITLPEGSILVTMDVSSLYTNIPNDEGIESIREILSTIGNPPISLLTETTTPK